MEFQPLQTSSDWVLGERYLLRFKARSVLGISIPVPRSQIDATLERIQKDEHVRVDSWSWDGTYLDLHMTAIKNPIPIAVIVTLVIGVAGIFGIALVLSQVGRVIESGGPVLSGGLGIAIAAAGVVAIMSLRR